MISFIVIMVIVPVTFYGLFWIGTHKPSPTQLTIDSRPSIATPKNLSAVAQQVYNEYMSLPAESRPFDNIVDILKSLDAVTVEPNNDRRDHFDVNHSRRKRYSHRAYAYDGSEYYPFKFAWSAGMCDHKDCKYSAYYDLHTEIERVKKALDDKARALVESENAHNVAMAAELVSALREEAGIQTKVTQEIRGKV